MVSQKSERTNFIVNHRIDEIKRKFNCWHSSVFCLVIFIGHFAASFAALSNHAHTKIVTFIYGIPTHAWKGVRITIFWGPAPTLLRFPPQLKKNQQLDTIKFVNISLVTYETEPFAYFPCRACNFWALESCSIGQCDFRVSQIAVSSIWDRLCRGRIVYTDWCSCHYRCHLRVTL